MFEDFFTVEKHISLLMRIKFFMLLILLPFLSLAQQNQGTVTEIGDSIPPFSFEIERGKKVNISAYQGKLILVNLFATWCPPCNIELPLVQSKIWEKYGGNTDFALFVFGREEGWDKLAAFKRAKGFTFPILPDADRSIFNKFATSGIPRNIIIDQNGKIIYQSIGYSEKEFSEMILLIDRHLEKQVKSK